MPELYPVACLDSADLTFGDCLYPNHCLCGTVNHFPEDCQPLTVLNWNDELLQPV